MQEKLNKLLNNTHSHYSDIKVSAVAIANGKEYKGVNIENASFGGTNCAERTAMFSAIADGNKAGSITDIHITSSVDKMLYPCGICLQVMSELCAKNLKVHIWLNGEEKIHSFDELLPMAIDRESFGWK